MGAEKQSARKSLRPIAQVFRFFFQSNEKLQMNDTPTTNGNYAAPYRTFPEAIKVCFAKCATFKGRASRSEYWWFFLFVALVSLVVFVTNDYLLDDYGLSGNIFVQLLVLAVLLPFYAVGARRLHDTGRSGWWMLLAVTAALMPESKLLYDLVFLIMWLPLIVMLCFRSKTDPAT